MTSGATAIPSSDVQSQPAPTPPASRRGGSLAASALSNWVWYLVVLASGFLLPPLIDRRYGREILGIWDLGWSLIFYINLLTLGIGSAVNRFVARCRAAEDWPGLNAAASSALLVLSASSAIGLILAVVFALWAPDTLPNLGAAERGLCRQFILLLGVNAALQLPEGVFNGVITGYERFTLLNVIRGARDTALLFVMVGLLLAGGGILALAWSLLISELGCFLVTIFVARRVCPTLQIAMRHCGAATVRQVMNFAGKTVAQELARSGLYQVNSQIVASLLGPAALAVYARPRALVMHLMRFVKQYAQVFVPKSSALDARADKPALQRLLIQSTRYGVYLALPPTLYLLVLGDLVLHVWMGPSYRVPAVMIVLAAGHLLSIPQMGVYAILMGMARHGRTATLELVSAGISVGLGILLVGVFKMGLLGAAIAVAAPLAFTSGILVPLYACGVVGLRFDDYARQVAFAPILLNLPLLGVLLIVRRMLGESPGLSLLVGVAAGGVLTTIVYYYRVLPATMRQAIVARLVRRGRTAAS
ncbi:MAG: oligosaccharide flippase family protein [Phycisphaerae bacterium]